MPWILGGIGAFVLLGLIGAVVVVVAISQAEDPVRPAATVVGGGQPNVETPSTATATVATPVTAATSAPAVKATAPTATPTFVTRPPVTVTPPTPTPPATNTNLPLGAFPRAKALNELDRVTATLASCKRAGDPTGAGTIRVDFEPDGRVGTLSRKPFSGTPTGSCISARFLAIRVGKFDGTTQQIERTFTIP